MIPAVANAVRNAFRALFLVSLPISSVHAATISQDLSVALNDSLNFSATGSVNPILNLSATQTLNFKGFDPQRGTLNSVTLSFSGNIHNTIGTSIVGLGVSSLGFIDDLFVVAGLAGDDSDTVAWVFGNSVRADCRVSTVFCIVPSIYDKSLSLTATTKKVANYIASGNITLTAFVSVPSSLTLTFFLDTSANGTSKVSFAEDISVTGTATLSYDYTAVAAPLPATWLLLGSGVVPLARLKRDSTTRKN